MNKSKRIIAVSCIGAAINLALFFTKLYIGLSVNSVAIYADALNSLLDCGVFLASIAVYAFLSPKKSDYPFGSGKAEELLEFIISLVILITGAGFAYASFERILYPMPVWYSSVYAAIIAGTAAAKLLLVLFFKAYSQKTSSPVIKGFAADSLLDFFITLCTLLSFTLSERLSFSADGFAGIIISIILIIQGIKSTASAGRRLTGKRDTALCEKVRAILKSEEKVTEIFELECHSYGETKIFTARIKSDCKTADEIYRLTEKIENKVARESDSRIFLTFGG